MQASLAKTLYLMQLFRPRLRAEVLGDKMIQYLSRLDGCKYDCNQLTYSIFILEL